MTRAAPPPPHRTVVGVTGHRTADAAALGPAVRDALHRIETVLRAQPGTSVVFTVCSSLAEGAARGGAHAGLARPGGRRAAIPPIPPHDSRPDFATAESRAEFDRLLAAAHSVSVVPQTGSREHRYAAAGRAVVDGCDVLLAVWDGEPARGAGGPAEVVAYARFLGRPLVWLRPDGGGGFSTTCERLTRLDDVAERRRPRE